MATTVSPDVSTPIPQAPVAGQTGKVIPFRRATYERTVQIAQSSVTPGAASQVVPIDVVGDGYMYTIVDDVVCTTAGNAAATAFQEDAPYSFFQRMQLTDVSGDLINLTGFQEFVNNVMNGQFAVFLPDSAAHTTLFAGTPLVSLTTGAGATGGSFSFMIRYTVGTGHRDLIGVVGNQSRTMKYQLTETIAPSALIWSTAPTAIPAIPILRTYGNYAVPNPQNALGVPQEVYPPLYGVVHRVTATTVEAPTASSTVSHYLKQVGNTIRAIGLIFRSNSLRATAETNAPTGVVLKAGSATLFQESWRSRKERNLRQFGFDMPAGVVIYDFVHDMDVKAGDEIGDDWLHSQQLSDLHFEITYPAGWNNAGSSLEVITDELLNVV